MKNKTVKLVIAILMILLIASLSTVSLCVDPADINIETGTTVGNKANNITGTIIGVMQIVGTAVAVIMLIWLAIKYVSAAPSEKADIKKSATIYVVGAILLFGAVGILQFIKGITEETFEETQTTPIEQEEMRQV